MNKTSSPKGDDRSPKSTDTITGQKKYFSTDLCWIPGAWMVGFIKGKGHGW